MFGGAVEKRKGGEKEHGVAARMLLPPPTPILVRPLSIQSVYCPWRQQSCFSHLIPDRKTYHQDNPPRSTQAPHLGPGTGNRSCVFFFPFILHKLNRQLKYPSPSNFWPQCCAKLIPSLLWLETEDFKAIRSSKLKEQFEPPASRQVIWESLWMVNFIQYVIILLGNTIFQ